MGNTAETGLAVKDRCRFTTGKTGEKFLVGRFRCSPLVLTGTFCRSLL